MESSTRPSTDGKAIRREVPRSLHAEWQPPADRDPVRTLAERDATRVPELVPVRYGRMLASPFAFFRGGAAVMAGDLATGRDTGLQVQLCGDAHLSNFGIFAAPDRRLVFDCNDFDETCRGPFEWDLKRLAASIAVAAAERGFDRRQRQQAVLDAAVAYRTSMREFAAMRNVDVWYARIDVEPTLAAMRKHVGAKRFREIERNTARARGKDSVRALRKLTTVEDGSLRIAADPPLITPLEALSDGADNEQQVRSVLSAYMESLSPDRRRLVGSYRYAHAARKVVGVGSVGTRAWIVLMLGRDQSDPLFLQAKEAQASVLEPHTGPDPFHDHGRRVVEGQRLMQAASDIFLGWLSAEGLDKRTRSFYVRQLWDGKGSVDVERMSPPELGIYAALCGAALARAHARSGDRQAIAAYLGGGRAFDKAIAEFAEVYMDQNARDYGAMLAAEERGEVEVVRGL